MCALSEGSQLKTNPFLSVKYAINLIAWLSLIPNFVVHRKPRWWRSNFNQTDWGFVIQFIYTSGQRYPYRRFRMKNLIIIVIRSKKEQIRKQEAEIARKIHEIASIEQFFSLQRPIINSTSNSLCSVICGPAIHAQFQFVNECCTSAARIFEDTSHFHSDKWDSWEQRCSTVFINYIFLLAIPLCLRKSGKLTIGNFTVLNLNVNQPLDLSDLFDGELLILEPWERASIKSGTWNIPEHPGTFRNIPEHGIIIIIMRKICKMKFSTTKWNKIELVSAWKINKKNRTKQNKNITNKFKLKKKRKLKMYALS